MGLRRDMEYLPEAEAMTHLNNWGPPPSSCMNVPVLQSYMVYLLLIMVKCLPPPETMVE